MRSWVAGPLNAVHKSLIKLQWAGLQCNEHRFLGYALMALQLNEMFN